jgi:hypothetical protein
MATTAAYMREYRKTLEGRAALMAQKRRDKARRRAIAVLISLHQSDWDEVFSFELRRVEEEFQQDQVDT